MIKIKLLTKKGMNNLVWKGYGCWEWYRLLYLPSYLLFRHTCELNRRCLQIMVGQGIIK